MAQGEDSKPQAIKAKQVNIRLTAEQDQLLKQHCNRTGMTTQAVIIDALKRVIEGFLPLRHITAKGIVGNDFSMFCYTDLPKRKNVMLVTA